MFCAVDSMSLSQHHCSDERIPHIGIDETKVFPSYGCVCDICSGGGGGELGLLFPGAVRAHMWGFFLQVLFIITIV